MSVKQYDVTEHSEQTYIRDATVEELLATIVEFRADHTCSYRIEDDAIVLVRPMGTGMTLAVES